MQLKLKNLKKVSLHKNNNKNNNKAPTTWVTITLTYPFIP